MGATRNAEGGWMAFAARVFAFIGWALFSRAGTPNPFTRKPESLQELGYDELCRRRDLLALSLSRASKFGNSRKKLMIAQADVERVIASRLAMADNHMQWLRMAHRYDSKAGWPTLQAEQLWRRAKGYQEEIDTHLGKDRPFSAAVVAKYRDYLLTEAIKASPVTVEELNEGGVKSLRMVA